MSVIILPNGTMQNNPARVAYSNLLEQGTVTASSVNPDYPVLNAFDWVTTDYFRPATAGVVYIELLMAQGQAANYLAFYGQDIWRYGGTIKLQYWTGSAWLDASVGVAPADNAPRIIFFNSITAPRWRVEIVCSQVFNLGALAFGEYTALPLPMYLGWTPPQLGRSNTVINSVSERGAFLGRSVLAKGVQTNLVLQGAADEWVRTTWLPFLKHAETKPFWFIPDAVKQPNECMFCWVENEIPPPTHTNYGYMGHTLQLRGLVE